MRRWFRPIMRYLPDFLEASSMALASSRVVAIGFSQRTCLPALRAYALLRVEAIGPGDDDGVDVGVLEHVLVIGVGLHAVLGGKLGDALGDGVGQCDKLAVGVGDALRDMPPLGN